MKQKNPCPDPERGEERPEERAGHLAMARTGDPHSATAQFFINVGQRFLDYPSRDGWGYAVFGKVVQGMDVVQKIARVPTGNVGPLRTCRSPRRHRVRQAAAGKAK
jgi:cyclophilin family peptidyl-prolyl cis-trans isomerase